MKNFQRIIIAALIALPVIIGMVMLVSGGYSDTKSIGSTSLKRVGLIRVEGAIYDSDNIVNQLRTFLEDNSVAGVLLRVNSPGGATAPSQEIYREVLRYKERNKTLVVSMGSLAASGGYYVSSPASKIFADPGTLTGSIGVIMSLPLYSDLAKKIGVEMRTYKAGKYKDIASPYREMTEKEHLIIQDLLDDTHEQFISDVAHARGLPFDSIAAIADGRIFTGRQAISYSLVDTLGGYADALHYLKEITGVSQKTKILERKERFGFFSDWMVEKVIHIFPQLSHFITPPGLFYLLSFDTQNP